MGPRKQFFKKSINSFDKDTVCFDQPCPLYSTYFAQPAHFSGDFASEPAIFAAKSLFSSDLTALQCRPGEDCRAVRKTIC
jgi:hypothetical protein